MLCGFKTKQWFPGNRKATHRHKQIYKELPWPASVIAEHRCKSVQIVGGLIDSSSLVGSFFDLNISSLAFCFQQTEDTEEERRQLACS